MSLRAHLRRTLSWPRSAHGTPRAYSELFHQDRTVDHWAIDYASRLAARHRPDHRIVIQTSMSPSGPFHVGNFRDTACAYLVHRALRQMNRRSVVLLSFDDYDPVRPAQADRDLELRDQAGRAQGALVSRAERLCDAYLDELRRMDLGLPTKTSDHLRDGPQCWLVHYQRQRYRAGTYTARQRRYLGNARRLASLLGVADERQLFAVYCEHCERNTTDIHELDHRRVRYECRTCRSLRTTEDLGVVKPVWALDWTLRVAHEGIDCEPAGQDHCSAGSTMDRTRPIYHRFLRRPQPVIVPYGLVRRTAESGKISGSQGGALTLSDLLAVLPATMILWLYGRTNCLSDFRIGLEPASIVGAYGEFDRFLARVGDDSRATALYRLITDEPVPPPLPRWSTVIGALHSACYERERAQQDLASRFAEADPDSLRERVIHAHNWLATYGVGSCWIVRDTAPTDHPSLAAGRLPDRWDRQRYRELYCSLFGTVTGPPLRRLEREVGRPALQAALSGPDPHPLRAVVLDNLGLGPDASPCDRLDPAMAKR